MRSKSPTSWEDLCHLVDQSIIEASSRLGTAIHKQEMDNFRQVEEKIEQYVRRGVVFISGIRLSKIEKQLDGKKYGQARKSLDSVNYELEQTLSLFNQATSAMGEIHKLRENINARGIGAAESEIERLDEMYRKGDYSSILKALPDVKEGMNAILERHLRINTKINQSLAELDEIEREVDVEDIRKNVIKAQQALGKGKFGESERLHLEIQALLKRRKEEMLIRWQPIEGKFRYIVPNYTITHRTGSGGSAVVYKGIDRDGKPVAIKLPKFLDGTLDTAVYNKFGSEAKIWAKLRHKNIVKFRKCLLDPVPCLIMELMEGGNLKDRMKTKKLTIREAFDIFLQLVDAISYAHRMASIHRDIKPENILFTRGGRPKISDWGIGKFMASVTETAGDEKKGTLAYSAPEQASPKKYGKIDWSTDIFQLGILFYEMLTGKNPFMADDPAGIITNILYETVEPPSSINSNISPELETIIMKALEKEKENRWRSADIMFHELKRYVEGNN